MVIQAMSGPWRLFHTPEHIFEVGQGGTPAEVVAALFHDLVYAQVDHGINLSLSRYLADCVIETVDGLQLDLTEHANSVPVQLAVDLFGFQHGQVLNPFAGQNEFLSALVALRSMHMLLPLPALAKIGACIEATIPFRRVTADSPDTSEQLHARLEKANDRFELGLSELDMHAAVESAVGMANRDVGNFASQHPASFLDNTWNLIPETNHDLRQVNTYTIRGYRTSLQKMEGFLGFLQADAVFRRYRNEPSPALHHDRLALTERNLHVARMYLRIKLVSVGLIEALSLRIGEDVSLASMMGKLPKHGESSLQLEKLLPPVACPQYPNDPLEIITLQLLQAGRTSESLHDTKHSPVASFLVQRLGFSATLNMYEDAQKFFLTPSLAEDWLGRLPPDVLKALNQGAYTLFIHRAQAFQTD
jgi:hypothetical protein